MNLSIKKSLVVFIITILVIGTVGLVSKQRNGSVEAVNLISERVLIPGGQSVGIKMNVKGVLVVGLEEIECGNGVVSPGYDAGIQIGDMITSINDIEVNYAKDVSEIVDKLVKDGHNEITLDILRKDHHYSFKVTPAMSYDGTGYKLGIWVKEKIAGIGTLTFYDPKTNMYAALGHGIYEHRTGTLLESSEGKLLRTQVKSIREGQKGKPGEIRGIFYGNEEPVGNVIKNTSIGVYSEGTEHQRMKMAEPMVMAVQEQISVGDAYILTTIDGNKVEKFDIKITAVNHQKKPDSKGMEIEVVDKRLLQSSGGIVQGMSGSPIIQNNRIAGAVTHVLVNNPAKGYGIFAEWMINECEK